MAGATPSEGEGRSKAVLVSVMAVIAVVGIGGTYLLGEKLKRESRAGWLLQADAAATQATLAAEGWVAQGSSIMNGLAVAFLGPKPIGPDDFADLAFAAEEWHTEFSLYTAAVARRVTRNQRAAFEAELGAPLSVIGKPDAPAPEVYESFAIQYSSDDLGLLRPGADLMTDPRMADVAATAHRVPGEVIMGAAYQGPAGDGSTTATFVLAGLQVTLGETPGVLVGEINLSDLIDYLKATHMPAGLHLRLAERDTEASETQSVLRPIFGTLDAHPNAIHTTTIRMTKGQARWSFYWDVLPDFQGGPPTRDRRRHAVGRRRRDLGGDADDRLSGPPERPDPARRR